MMRLPGPSGVPIRPRQWPKDARGVKPPWLSRPQRPGQRGQAMRDLLARLRAQSPGGFPQTPPHWLGPPQRPGLGAIPHPGQVPLTPINGGGMLPLPSPQRLNLRGPI